MRIRDVLRPSHYGPPPSPLRTLMHTEPLELRMPASVVVEAEWLADARGLTPSRLFLQALQLTRVLSPAEWQLWQQEAEARGLTAIQLIESVLKVWQEINLRRSSE